jgi:hypothetical protein
MKCATLAVIVAGLICLEACASTNVIVNASAVVPMTHQPQTGSVTRTTGLLRRLAILPARIEFTPSDPKRCVETCDWDRLRLEVAENVPSYLADWRGYEVVALDPLLVNHASVELPGVSLDDFVGELATFAEQRSTEPPSEQLTNSVRQVAKQLWVDGIVVIRGSVVVGTWIEAGLGLALAASGYGLLAALPIQMARVGSKFEAYIFETAVGRLVWASVYSSGGNPLAQPPAANNVITQLLDPLEPALPAVMTRTIEPPEE